MTITSFDERLAHAATLAIAPTAILCYEEGDGASGDPFSDWAEAFDCFLYWEDRIGSWSEILGDSDRFNDLLSHLDRWDNDDDYNEYCHLVSVYAKHALELLLKAGENTTRELAKRAS